MMRLRRQMCRDLRYLRLNQPQLPRKIRYVRRSRGLTITMKMEWLMKCISAQNGLIRKIISIKWQWVKRVGFIRLRSWPYWSNQTIIHRVQIHLQLWARFWVRVWKTTAHPRADSVSFSSWTLVGFLPKTMRFSLASRGSSSKCNKPECSCWQYLQLINRCRYRTWKPAVGNTLISRWW